MRLNPLILLVLTCFGLALRAYGSEWLLFDAHLMYSQTGTQTAPSWRVFKGSEERARDMARGLGWDFQPNYTYYATGSDDLYDQCWALKNTGQSISTYGSGRFGVDIGAEQAWALQMGSPDVVVAVLDSGWDRSHPDLSNGLWTNSRELGRNGRDDDANGFVDDFHGWNFVGQNGDIQDQNGHGTYVSGLIVADANRVGGRGVAPGARVMPLVVLDQNGVGSTRRAVAAIKYAVTMGAKILNLSWGNYLLDPLLEKTLRWASSQGVLILAAAGNDGRDNDGPEPYYPASYDIASLISVAAYDFRESLAKFSNYGSGSVAVGAPGVHLLAPKLGGGYGYVSGTSFATPIVGGVAALLWSYFPTLSSEGVKTRLLESSEPMHLYDLQRSSSGGRVHAGNALSGHYPARVPIPTTWHTFVVQWETPHPYGPRKTYRYRFHTPGATFLKVRFKAFATESCCDRVSIRDSRGRLIRRYSGGRGSFWSAIAEGDTLFVELHTDYRTEDYGISIDALAASFE